MQLIILDKEFQPLAPVNELQSLIWDRRYREPGIFELHAGPGDFPGIRDGAYLYRGDRDELGVISVAHIERDKTGRKTCYAKGYFGEILLDDRVIDRTQRLKGTPEEIARELVNRYFINTAESGEGNYAGRSLAGHLALGELSEEDQTPTSWQRTGSAVGSALYELEATQGLSHRLRYDYEEDRLLFEIWKGKDRGALLSDKYGNLTSTSYHRDTTDAPNMVYIAGGGEGTQRKVYLLDLRQSLTEATREMYVDARDLQQDYTGEDGQSYHYTDEDYEELLAERGRQKAAEHQAQERFEASVDANANLIYRQDYDLGDICLAQIDGVELEKQITGIRETYEAARETMELTLGDYAPTSLQSYIARQAQINESAGAPSSNVGDLSQLETEEKGGVVPAINELDRDIGDLNDLETESKSSLVDAINEIKESGGGGGGTGGAGNGVGEAIISSKTLSRDIASGTTTLWAFPEGEARGGQFTVAPWNVTLKTRGQRHAVGGMAGAIQIPGGGKAPKSLDTPIPIDYQILFHMAEDDGGGNGSTQGVTLYCQLTNGTVLSPEMTGESGYLIAYYPTPLNADIGGANGSPISTRTTLTDLTRVVLGHPAPVYSEDHIGYDIKLGDAFSLDSEFSDPPATTSERLQAWLVFTPAADGTLSNSRWARLKVQGGNIIACEEIYT